MLRTPTVIAALLFLSGCGLTERFFTTDECEGDTCEAPVLLDNSKVEKEWFCYGKAEDDIWECLNQRDPSRIQAIEPKSPRTTSRPPLGASPVAANSISQPVVAPEPASPPPQVRLPETQPFDEVILAAPADYYAVQLIALRDIAGVREYAGLNGIENPNIVRIKNDDTNWYVLLLGIYADRDLADAAREDWGTAKVLRVQPWIRQLGPLQDAIRAARQ